MLGEYSGEILNQIMNKMREQVIGYQKKSVPDQGNRKFKNPEIWVGFGLFEETARKPLEKKQMRGWQRDR